MAPMATQLISAPSATITQPYLVEIRELIPGSRSAERPIDRVGDFSASSRRRSRRG
jgi:hypothetical protein